LKKRESRAKKPLIKLSSCEEQKRRHIRIVCQEHFV
jgi:hypothetical protein